MARLTLTFARNWTGQIDLDPYLPGPTPQARLEYLVGVDSLVLQAALTYIQPALCFDGRQTAAGTKRLTLVIPPAATQGRPYVTQFGSEQGVAQGAIDIDTTSSGSLGTSYDLTADADTIRIPPQAVGASAYADTAARQYVHVFGGGNNTSNTPAAVGNRLAELAAGAVRSVEDVEIEGCAGFGFCVTVHTEDLETL